MAKILITGGAGFIGSNACNILSKAGHEVTALDSLVLGTEKNLDPGVLFIKGDVCSEDDLAKVGTPDYIIHLAAASSLPMFADDLKGSFSNNIIGHLTVLEFARKNNVKKVLFASTSSMYGNNPIPLTEDQTIYPPNFYSVSKHAQEEISAVYHNVHDLEIIAFRFMSVYGLHEESKGRFANLVSQFIWGIEGGKKPVIYGDGTQTRDFVNVRDVVSAFKLALETPKKFGFTVFNIGTASAIEVRDLISIINEVMGTSAEPKFIENPVRTGYLLTQQADLSKIKKELGFQETVTLKQGIEEIVEFRKKNPIVPRSLSY